MHRRYNVSGERVWMSERWKSPKEKKVGKNGGVRSGAKIDVKTMKWLNERHTKPYKAK